MIGFIYGFTQGCQIYMNYNFFRNYVSDIFILLIYDISLHYCKCKLFGLNTYGVWGLEYNMLGISI